MSEIYTDAAGNKYLGDCRWGNHDINYPATNFLLASPHTSLSAGLTNLLTQAGLPHRNVVSQASLDLYETELTVTYSKRIMNIGWFGFPGDIDDRFLFTYSLGWNPVDYKVTHYNDSGSTVSSLTNSELTTNRLYHLATGGINSSTGNGSQDPLVINTPSPTLVDGQWVGVGSANCLSLCWSQHNLANNTAGRGLFYVSRLLDVNTNFNYYSNSFNNNTITLLLSSYIGAGAVGGHYIGTGGKFLLQTGRAAYTISCSDGQTPGAQWATDMWVYDNNATLGYPVIGRVPNMLLGIGSYTYLKPVKIQGSVFPDNGSPWYLPVGTFAGKTLLMRCYSSMA